MPFIVVNGTLDLPVGQMSEQEPILLGDTGRSADGTFRGDITGEKRMWDVTWIELTTAQYNDLRAAVALLTPVTITGDAFPGTPRTMIVRLSSAPYVRDGGSWVRDVSAKFEDA